MHFFGRPIGSCRDYFSGIVNKDGAYLPFRIVAFAFDCLAFPKEQQIG
jgi:hypothetical protein